MKIFDAEREISDLIIANTSVAYVCAPNPVEISTLDFAKARLERRRSNSDLYCVYSLLASSTWNDNDDVFGKKDLWVARNTPVDHPTNINHDQINIVGHITDAWVVDADLNLITNVEDTELLPDLIHIINESVIYTEFKDEQKTAQINDLIAAIEQGRKFVSMEARFSHFNYAIERDGETFVIERNEQTAFLTKYLKAYGGKGVYNDMRIGRKMEDYYFIGKGYVDNPANKPSKIFITNPPGFTYSSVKQDLKEIGGVLLNNENVEKTMSVDLEKQLSDTKAKLDLVQSDYNQLKDKFAELEKSFEAGKQTVAAKDDEIQALLSDKTALETSVSELKQSIETFEAQVANLEKEKTEAVEAKTNLENEQKKIVRSAKLISAGYKSDEAEKLVNQYFNLSDEQWSGISDAFEAQKKVTNTTEGGLNLNFPEEGSESEAKAKRTKELQAAVASLFKKETE